MLHCNQLVEQAREQVLYNIAASQQVMDNMRGVLTPQQASRASKRWATRRRPFACIRMLTLRCMSSLSSLRAGGSLPRVGGEAQAQHGGLRAHLRRMAASCAAQRPEQYESEKNKNKHKNQSGDGGMDVRLQWHAVLPVAHAQGYIQW